MPSTALNNDLRERDFRIQIQRAQDALGIASMFIVDKKEVTKFNTLTDKLIEMAANINVRHQVIEKKDEEEKKNEDEHTETEQSDDPS
jgi:hypothetical protein